MKTAEEAYQIQDMCDRISSQVEASYRRLGIEDVSVYIGYHNDTEVIAVSIDHANKDRTRTSLVFKVNVNMDSVKATISELVRELIVHIVQEFTGE